MLHKNDLVIRCVSAVKENLFLSVWKGTNKKNNDISTNSRIKRNYDGERIYMDDPLSNWIINFSFVRSFGVLCDVRRRETPSIAIRLYTHRACLLLCVHFAFCSRVFDIFHSSSSSSSSLAASFSNLFKFETLLFNGLSALSHIHFAHFSVLCFSIALRSINMCRIF